MVWLGPRFSLYLIEDRILDAWASAFLLWPFRARLWTSPLPAMARHIAEGFTTVPWAPTWQRTCRPSPSRTGGPSGMSSAPVTGCRRTRRGCCAWSGGTRSSSLRPGPRQSRNSSPAVATGVPLAGQPGLGRLLQGPEEQRPPGASGDVAPGPRPPRLVGRGFARSGLRPRPPLSGGLASLPARWAPQWAVHTHQTGDSDDDPLFGCLHCDEDIPEFEPPIRVRVAGRPDGPLCAWDLQSPGLLPGSSGSLGQGGALPSPRRRGGHSRQVRAAHRGRQGSRHGLAPARRRARRVTVAVVLRVLGRQVH